MGFQQTLIASKPIACEPVICLQFGEEDIEVNARLRSNNLHHKSDHHE